MRAETEAKLHGELASLREQAEAARRAQAQAQQQAEAAREQAARDVQVAAQRAAAKAFEVEAARIRAEAEVRSKEESERANQRLEAEVARLRAEQLDRPPRQQAPAAPPPIARQEYEPPPAPAQVEAPRQVFADRFTASDAGDGDDSHTWKVWIAAAAAAATVVIIGTGGYLLWNRTPETPKAEAPAPQPEVIETLPEEVETPGPRGRRNSRPEPPRAGRPAAAAATEATGKTAGLLTVYSRVPLDLVVDGVRIGSTEDGQIVVPPGRRRVELVNKRLNYRGEVTLDVASGKVTTHTATLPPGQLRIAGAAGGEVWVEGEHVGTLPLADISVPLGTREVLVRHPQFGERRQTVEVTYGAPTQVSMVQQEAGSGN